MRSWADLSARISRETAVKVSSRVLLQSQTAWRFADEGDVDAKPREGVNVTQPKQRLTLTFLACLLSSQATPQLRRALRSGLPSRGRPLSEAGRASMPRLDTPLCAHPRLTASTQHSRALASTARASCSPSSFFSFFPFSFFSVLLGTNPRSRRRSSSRLRIQLLYQSSRSDGR